VDIKRVQPDSAWIIWFTKNQQANFVSNINSPTYKLAKWLVSKFKEFHQPTGRYVKNSFDFVDKIKNIRLEDDEIMVSFDIVSLYSNVPLRHDFVAIKNWLQTITSSKDHKNLSQIEINTLMDATKLCMEQSQFRFRNNFYKLRDSTCMGNPLPCFVANIFMCMFETELSNFLPKTWYRYVDDVFAIIKKVTKGRFTKVFKWNQIHIDKIHL